MPAGTPRLLAWKGEVWIGEWRLDPARTLRIGRSRDCEIFLDDEHVSRVHAEIRPVPGGWEVVDLGSTGGTRVDDVRTQRHRLRSGNRIQIGAIGLLAQDLDPAPARPPPRSAPPGRRPRR